VPETTRMAGVDVLKWKGRYRYKGDIGSTWKCCLGTWYGESVSAVGERDVWVLLLDILNSFVP
jgi:hypothetical protein